MAAFSLLSVLSAQAANIKISALPFSITASGTYVLTGNLSYTGSSAAIGISAPMAGAVILDLKGFTITNTGGALNGGINAVLINAQQEVTSPVTIRNGTITGFTSAIFGNRVSDIIVNNLNFNQNVLGVEFESSANSNINNCQFNGFSALGVTYGISDRNSPGGNSYNNNTFINISQQLTEFSSMDTTVVLSHCQFAAPPSN
jgi:hypothetical protein